MITKEARPAPLPPHPVLRGYYPDEARRSGFVRDLFDRTAPLYDRLNRILSFGSGGRFRRESLLRAGLRPGMRVIDLATGTGLVAAEALEILNGKGTVIGLDLSAGMLAAARARLRLPVIQGGAELLPLAEESFDFLSMGYALRHLADLGAAFREFHRVLRPGGTVLLLEIARPERPLGQLVVSLYLKRLVPRLAQLVTGRGAARLLMAYYWDTIEHCVAPETILGALREAGFEAGRSETVSGVFRNYLARKPAGSGRAAPASGTA